MVNWLTRLVARFVANDDRANLNCNRNPFNRNDNLGIVHFQDFIFMKSYKNLYEETISLKNLILAWRKARKHKTKKDYVIEFEKETRKNLLRLYEELQNQTYSPKPLVTFVLRDPKTRKISKSDFRDRIIHHALVRILVPIFDKTFIYDNCANRKGKGTIFAIKRFTKFQRRVTNNLTSSAYCLKADIKHYFQEVDLNILIQIISRKIKDKKVLWLINKILDNTARIRERETHELLKILRECL